MAVTYPPFPTYPATTLQESIDIFEVAADQIHNFVNGSDTDEVTAENGNIPSIRKIRKDLFETVGNVRKFNSVSDMQTAANAAELATGQIVETVGYFGTYIGTANPPKGGNHYELVDAGSAGARPAEDGGSVIHVTGGSGGLYLKGLFLDGAPSVYQFAAKGDGIADDTQAFARIDAYSATYRIPAGVFRVDSITVGDNTTVITEGYETVLHQNVNLVGDIRVVNVTGSNVVFALDGIKVKGNIVDDDAAGASPAGQRHGIIVRNTSTVQRNVRIGDVYGEDLHGDVLYIGATTAQPSIESVHVGDVYGKNIYRNVVSGVGGSSVEIGNIYEDSTTGCNLATLDIEPDQTGVVASNWVVGNVYGRGVGCVAQFSAFPLHNIHLGDLDIDPTRNPASVVYAVSAGDFAGRALVIRNATVVTGNADLKNCSKNPIFGAFSAGDIYSSLLMQGHVKIRTPLTGAVEVSVIKGNGLGYFYAKSLDTQCRSSATDFVFEGDSSGPNTKIKIDSVKADCRLARFCGFDVAQADISFADDLYLFQNINAPSTLRNAKISSGRLTSFALNTAQVTLDACDLSWTGSFKYAGSPTGLSHVVEVNCAVNGTWTGMRVDDVAVTVP